MAQLINQGSHPRLAAVALALLGAWPALGLAQAVGGTAIHGQASIAVQGNQTVITTQNGAGTSHSAINWQAFSVPAGSVTRFVQPDAASLSINRVVGNNPSQIFGTLSSNGKLVLVNPAGIAVGAGAVVDTAGFTASALRMTDADALAGRLRFGTDGLAGGAVTVDGRITAQMGDVVLIASNVGVGSAAFVQAPGGAVVLAAGRTVELTGRGLEGIRMEVTAPADTAVNLGTLSGDAVGIFAANLRHSGLIRATGAFLEGSKLQLVASNSKVVDGVVLTPAAGQPLSKDEKDPKDDKTAKDDPPPKDDKVAKDDPTPTKDDKTGKDDKTATDDKAGKDDKVAKPDGKDNTPAGKESTGSTSTASGTTGTGPATSTGNAGSASPSATASPAVSAPAPANTPATQAASGGNQPAPINAGSVLATAPSSQTASAGAGDTTAQTSSSRALDAAARTASAPVVVVAAAQVAQQNLVISSFVGTTAALQSSTSESHKKADPASALQCTP